jgi:putative effector of murein hydrolase LrgA (UPF0299 family)
MIAGLVEILLFQGAGEVISRFVVPLIPGPVIGLLLLLGYLVLRGSVPRHVEVVASGLTQHLGLLFIPAAVGVVMYWPNLRANALAVAVALVGSAIATIAVTAVVQKLVSGRHPK